MKPSPHIAVVGAGIAGLSCAAALQQAGLVVSLFEKSRGPAGRMSTRRGDDWQCDHGAQYFTARQPAFAAELTRWIEAGVAHAWSPRLQVLGGASSRSPDPAVERFVGVPQMTAPARFMASALTVNPETHVLELTHRDRGWQLRSAEHGWLTPYYDAVLVAIPAPQAVTLLEQPAPELAAVAASATMRGCWALMLRFATELDLTFDAAFVNEGPLRWIARDSSKPGRRGPETWLLHASAEWSEEHLEADPRAVAAELLRAFSELGGDSSAAWTAHRWRYADTAPAMNQGCVWHAGDGLGLCGDWLNGGKVEGAWLSGRQLASLVLQTLR
jgi:predicted NAD/FAD-dependent oxidoreductase